MNMLTSIKANKQGGAYIKTSRTPKPTVFPSVVFFIVHQHAYRSHRWKAPQETHP
jgi:hypothetical protein